MNLYSVERKKINQAMEEIGFFQAGRYYKTEDSRIMVEFPSGPLSVGGEPIKEIEELQFSTGVLRIISPTECVKDRLCAYYFWGDRQGLEQAILVALSKRVNAREIKRWSMAEGMSEPQKIRKNVEGTQEDAKRLIQGEIPANK